MSGPAKPGPTHQLRALVGWGQDRAEPSLKLKRRPISPRHRAGFLGAVTMLVVLPYAEELWPCARAAGAGTSKNTTAEEQT